MFFIILFLMTAGAAAVVYALIIGVDFGLQKLGSKKPKSAKEKFLMWAPILGVLAIYYYLLFTRQDVRNYFAYGVGSLLPLAILLYVEEQNAKKNQE